METNSPEGSRARGRKRVVIGRSEWGIHDSKVEVVAAKIEAAMVNGTAVALPLLDSADREVTVWLNGRITGSVTVDLDLGGPKPTEISGG